MADRILQLTKLEKTQQIAIQSVNLENVISQVAHAKFVHSLQTGVKVIAQTFDHTEKLITLGDPRLIEQAVSNLVDNVIDLSLAHTTIHCKFIHIKS